MLPAIFVSSFIFSFLGSVPPGAINLSLFQIGKTEGNGKASLWAIWAAAMEGIHLSIAWFFHQQIIQHPILEQCALLFSGIILAFSGIYLLRKKVGQTEGPLLSWRQFTMLNLFNPMAIPFWIGALQLLMPSQNEGILFGLGSVMGGMVCLIGFGWLGSKFKFSEFLKTSMLNRSIAYTMLVLAAWQSFQFAKVTGLALGEKQNQIGLLQSFKKGVVFNYNGDLSTDIHIFNDQIFNHNKD